MPSLELVIDEHFSKEFFMEAFESLYSGWFDRLYVQGSKESKEIEFSTSPS